MKTAAKRKPARKAELFEWQGSAPEMTFLAQLRDAGIRGFVREYQFYPGRRYRFDYADIAHRIGIEIQGAGPGGVGRHGYASGMEKDCEKQALAVRGGWRVLKATARQVENGTLLEWLRAIL